MGLMREPQLNPEDQAKVDEFVSTGVNSVERKPFRPFRLLIFLVVIVTCLSGLSLLLARVSGVY
jgi:hypothetical protein